MIAHDVLTYLCARSVGFSEKYIKIRPYKYSEFDGGPYSRDHEEEKREGKRPAVVSTDPMYDENEYYADFVQYSDPVKGEIPAIQVLSLYSNEPDWGMDSGIRISPLQALTGGSQGYRHLRYGLFLLRAGIAQKRTLYFRNLAETAFKKDDIYWGVRFSARAIHYLEDLLTPLHTKPFTETYLLEKLFHFKDLYFITYNYHLNFERFVAYHLWHGNRHFIRAVEDAVPVGLPSLKLNILSGSRQIRSLFYPIFRECKNLWGDTMKGRFVKILKKDILEINPPSELKKSIERWLSLSASFVKGYIKEHVIPLSGALKK